MDLLLNKKWDTDFTDFFLKININPCSAGSEKIIDKKLSLFFPKRLNSVRIC
jgi:hypothetical protein